MKNTSSHKNTKSVQKLTFFENSNLKKRMKKNEKE